MTNIDEFKAEYEADKVAAAEAADKAAAEAAARQQAAVEAERRAAYLARARLLWPLRQRIMTAIALAQPAAAVFGAEDDFTITLDGVKVNGELAFENERVHSYRYASITTDKIVIVTGGYGNRTRYPQRKDGTHKYDAIAAHLLGYARGVLADQKARELRSRNEKEATKVRAEFNLKDYNRAVGPSTDLDKPIHVDLNGLYHRSQNMTVEQARSLFRALEAHGFKVAG